MKKIALLLLCVCFFAASVLTGCTPTPTAEGTGGTEAATGKELTTLKIEAWGIETDPNSVIIKEAVQLYNQRNDNVELTIEFTEQEQYKTKIATLMAANEAPDLFNTWAAGFLKPFVTSGKVYSISEDLDKDPEWKNRFVPGIFAGFTYDGKIYASPNTQTVVCLFYNKEIFDKYNLEVPETYEELKTVVKTLNDNGIIPFALGNKAPWVGAMYSELVANRIGGSEPFDKVYNKTGTWLDPSFIKAGEIMYELAQMNAFPEGFNALDNDPSREMFLEGKAAMHVMGSWAIQQLTYEGSPLIGKLDVAKFPAIEGGKGDINNWLGQPDQSFAISARCKDKEAAVKFLKLMADPEIQLKFAEAGNLIATNAQLDPAKANPIATKVAELQKDMNELFIFYDVALGAAVGNEYNNAIQAITAGTDPVEAFTTLQEYTEQNYE
ncbi:MAG TPA: ABC transporter substrate-binding protein [Ruminiclostridium sp.]|jgi:raffinose/stachyose/melibiose transport system substrate-binding protein|nr:ABC transporter substrate-binding protein [Ruminiclostridium sp.]